MIVVGSVEEGCSKVTLPKTPKSATADAACVAMGTEERERSERKRTRGREEVDAFFSLGAMALPCSSALA